MKKRFVQNLISSFALFFFVYMIWLQLQTLLKGDWTVLGIITYWAIAATLLLVRKPSQDESVRPMHWVIAIGACVISFLIVPEKQHIDWLMKLAIPIQAISTVWLLVALVSLGRCFGIIAARRDIKTGGLYRFVRHPIYAGDFFLGLSAIMMHLSWHNALVFLTVTACQILRIQEEERVLSKDPAYVTYRDTVRFRLIPGIY